MNINTFNIQHFSTGDGAGIRSTVFLGGCPLRCPWCHNPECFTNTKTMAEEEVISSLVHDKEFYDRSGGGITISGGEPLGRLDECLFILEEMKKRGINTALDTALPIKDLPLEKLVELTDTFLVDVKTTDAEAFKKVCRGNLEVVFENIDKLAKLGADIIFRIPLIPGFNVDVEGDGPDPIDGIIDFISKYNYKFTLHGFHRLGSGKYTDLGMTYAYADVEQLSKEKIDEVRERFLAKGLVEAKI